MVHTTLQVQADRVNIGPLIQLLKLTGKELEKTKALAPGSWLTVEQAEEWLRTLKVPSTAQSALKSLQATAPMQLRNTVSYRVAESLRQHSIEQRRDAVILVNQPLEPVDHFRADASLGPHRLNPDLIQYTVRNGVLDLFVLEDDVFGGTEGTFRQVEVDVADGFRRGLLNDFRAHSTVLTGPEFQEKHPDHHLLKRKTLPPSLFLNVEGDKQELVQLPERPALFRWERYKETT